MIGYHWGYWGYPGPSWVWPPPAAHLYSFPFNSYPEGTCSNYSALDLQLLDDEDLRQNIIASLYDDPRIPRPDKEKITVDVQDKIARLSGTVRYRQSKVQAYLNALEAVGIADVRNEIKLAHLI
ncbi:MAG TPA: BON domain-containing protein [Patescibacteria group bacterium]|nr:BON domain-containing protein [Patescibacteria group bacterium]